MPLTIFFSSPGTYTIEDDGIRGNGISQVLDASGTVLFPFAHPGDTLDFIAEVPGINFVFNTLDSFGTANVTVGSLTDPALSPDSIVVKQMRTDAFMTLVADGTITEGGADTPADIIAAGLTMSAGTGIGTAANALETQVTFIEAETNTGGINIANFGNIQIGGLTPEVRGLFVQNSGDINFSNLGFILAADGTGSASIHGGDLSGNVTLTAIGADADIFSNIDQAVINAAGGGVTLNAGRDVIFGTSGTNFNNDILATNTITVRAGRDFQLDGTSDFRTGAFGGVSGGAIDIQAGRNINLSSVTGGLQTIQAFNGDVILTTGPGGVFFENAAFPGAVQTTADILLNADNVQINSGGLNTTGIGSVTIRSVTPGRAINLGTALDGPVALGLSDNEFDLLFTLNVNIGDANSGPVEFSAPLTPFIVDNLVVRSATEILVNSSIALPRSLTLRSGDDLFFTPSGSFTSTNGGFTGFVDDAQADGGAGGAGNLGGSITVMGAINLIGNSDNDSLNGGSGPDTIQGLGGNDKLLGLAGNDRLDGGLGIDLMTGGGGDDIYLVDNTGDQVVEAASGGYDRVATGVSYVLALGQEIEFFTTNNAGSTSALDLTGNEFANYIIGNAGANRIDGKVGADTMQGIGGNDIYIVDNAGDLVLEAVGGGNDRVATGVSYALAAGQEIELFTTDNAGSTSAINLTGNEFGNYIIGNAGANTFDGKGGADTMQGLGGNDLYHVDNIGDQVIEAAGGGYDRVAASVSYVLAAGQQIEVFTTNNAASTSALDLTGNEFANSIAGNAGANRLDGRGGADSMQGLGGNDIYLVDNAGDQVIEAVGGGNDRVATSVNYALAAGQEIELFTTTNTAGIAAISMVGNAHNQTIIANAGNNILNGGAGNDTLTGLGGSDTFVFNTALSPATNVDIITDFSVVDDAIVLENAVFAGLADGMLSANAFRIGAAAADADDRIIYNNATGQLIFDSNGNAAGGATQFATLAAGLALTNADFFVI